MRWATHMLGEKTVLAIDPGSSKCGIALVHRNANDGIEMLFHEIVVADNLSQAAYELHQKHNFTLIIVGNGTRSKNVIDALREIMPSIGILVVDETNTTMEARERFWEHNPRRGWRRLLPATMQVPPVAIDDYAAFVLAERVLKT